MIKLILDIVSDIASDNIAMNDEERIVINKIEKLGEKGLFSLTPKETEHVITAMSYHDNYSWNEMDECFDFIIQNNNRNT